MPSPARDFFFQNFINNLKMKHLLTFELTEKVQKFHVQGSLPEVVFLLATFYCRAPEALAILKSSIDAHEQMPDILKEAFKEQGKVFDNELSFNAAMNAKNNQN